MGKPISKSRLIAILGVLVGLIVLSSRRDLLDRLSASPTVSPAASPDAYKTPEDWRHFLEGLQGRRAYIAHQEEQAQAMRTHCKELRDKTIADLTVNELSTVQGCRVIGY